MSPWEKKKKTYQIHPECEKAHKRIDWALEKVSIMKRKEVHWCVYRRVREYVCGQGCSKFKKG